MEQYLINEEALRISQWFCLLQSGAISQVEYDAIKHKVLSGMGIEIEVQGAGGEVKDEKELKPSETLPPPRQNQGGVPVKKMKKIFKTCAICGNTFEAGSGRAVYCPECKGMKRKVEESDTASDSDEEAASDPKPLQIETVPEVTRTPVTGKFVACRRKDCFYRSDNATHGTCDYILKTGKPRGCSVEHCDKYRKKESKRNEKS